VPAPAKINLFLHIVGRRPDGYHLLQTAFRMLDWGDEITLQRRDDGLILRTTDVPGVPAESDLVVRAARALQAASGSRFGADIGVLKRIPMGGGLGAAARMRPACCWPSTACGAAACRARPCRISA
jgi:4-diphosphocytidyl-2-C-methyl-D-erythritol kinase